MQPKNIALSSQLPSPKQGLRASAKGMGKGKGPPRRAVASSAAASCLPLESRRAARGNFSRSGSSARAVTLHNQRTFRRKPMNAKYRPAVGGARRPCRPRKAPPGPAREAPVPARAPRPARPPGARGGRCASSEAATPGCPRARGLHAWWERCL